MKLTRESHRVLAGEATTHLSILGVYVVVLAVLAAAALFVGCAIVAVQAAGMVRL